MKSVSVFFLLMFSFSASKANVLSQTDTAAPLHLAAYEENYCLEILPANVTYPDLLSGHEAETMEYIERFSQNRRDYLIRMHQKSKRYFTRIKNIFSKYGVPDEFCVLIALESAFNPNAISRAGAVGYWQFMESVAREYGLRTLPLSQLRKPVRSTKGKPAPSDDRKNFVKSTHAAGRYLRDRARNLNSDWLLMAASYNWGVGNVRNCLQRTGKENPSFWDIKNQLPAETRSYVMNFIALNVIFHNYDAFLKKELRFRDEVIKVPVNPAQGQIAVM